MTRVESIVLCVIVITLLVRSITAQRSLTKLTRRHENAIESWNSSISQFRKEADERFAMLQALDERTGILWGFLEGKAHPETKQYPAWVQDASNKLVGFERAMVELHDKCDHVNAKLGQAGEAFTDAWSRMGDRVHKLEVLGSEADDARNTVVLAHEEKLQLLTPIPDLIGSLAGRIDTYVDHVASLAVRVEEMEALVNAKWNDYPEQLKRMAIEAHRQMADGIESTLAEPAPVEDVPVASTY